MSVFGVVRAFVEETIYMNTAKECMEVLHVERALIERQQQSHSQIQQLLCRTDRVHFVE